LQVFLENFSNTKQQKYILQLSIVYAGNAILAR